MNAFILKMIASVAMLIDHMGHGRAYLTNSSEITFWMRVIGRMAFPIYVFLIAEGCRHTRDMRKYLLRLGFFAFLSEPFFDMLIGFMDADFLSIRFWLNHFSYQNVFFTLFLGAAAVYCFCQNWKKSLPYKVAAVLGVILCVALSVLLKTDYAGVGVIFIFVCYICNSKVKCLLAVFIFVFCQYYAYTFSFLIGGLCSVFLLALYNEKRGPNVRWFFYAFYPAHLFVLAVFFRMAYYFS